MTRASAIRLAAISIVVTTLAVHAAVIYPIVRELDTAATARATYTARGTVEVRVEDVARARGELAPATASFAHWFVGDAQTGGNVATLAVLVTATEQSSELMFTPVSALLESAATPAGPWIDINSRAAHELGAGPGDIIDLEAGPDRTIPLEVRRIYGVGEYFGGQIAVAPASAILPHLDNEGQIQSVVFVAGLDSQELAERLAGDFFTSRLAEGGYDITGGPEVWSREDDARAMAQSSSASLAMIVAITVAAIIGGAALISREITWFIGVNGPWARTLTLLGAPPRTVTRHLALIGAGAVGLAISAGWVAGIALMHLRLFVPAVPPTLMRLWLVWGAATALTSAAVAWAKARHVHRTWAA